MRRGYFIQIMLTAFSLFLLPMQSLAAALDRKGNYRWVYENDRLRNKFRDFLENVFHLVPTDEFHNLIHESTVAFETDKEIYLDAQSKIEEITPSFSSIRYQLPALMRQKEEMAAQTLDLIGEGTSYNGYLEIGSSGRYLDYLEEKVDIDGNRYYADGKEPGYSMTEMIDRGQICIGAEYIPMTNYRTEYSKIIPNESLDLVTVYIGFHHCPLELRIPFISSIRDTMRTGAKLVLRDHDCHDNNQEAIVALAHDVFNMGTFETWEYNAAELRNFYSLEFIIEFVEKIGYKFQNRTIFQDGDPTKNALMLFIKTD